MIDFTNSIKKNKAYAGANGSKIAVVYNGEQYMLKFPPFPTINKGISYTNSCISEYIGCKIFESVGIPVQKTILLKEMAMVQTLLIYFQQLRRKLQLTLNC